MVSAVKVVKSVSNAVVVTTIVPNAVTKSISVIKTSEVELCQLVTVLARRQLEGEMDLYACFNSRSGIQCYNQSRRAILLAIAGRPNSFVTIVCAAAGTACCYARDQPQHGTSEETSRGLHCSLAKQGKKNGKRCRNRQSSAPRAGH